MIQIHETSPYAGFPLADYQPAAYGWGFDSPIFEAVVNKLRPNLIIEVGTYLGGSALVMADLLKRYELTDSQVVCVDTWAGLTGHWLNEDWVSLGLNHGRPERLYRQFLANVLHYGHDDVVLPFPVSSGLAAEYFKKKAISVDAVYVDAGHSYLDVAFDLAAWWPIVRPGGILFGDDLNPDFPGVEVAVMEFSTALALAPDLTYPGKWLLEKGRVA